MQKELTNFSNNPVIRSLEETGNLISEGGVIRKVRSTHDAVGVLLHSNVGFSCAGEYIDKEKCDLVELLTLQQSRNVFFRKIRIRVWSIPNLKVEDMLSTSIDDLSFESGCQINLGFRSKMKVDYVMNKSDGVPCKVFSFFTDQWYNCAYYEGKIYFQGMGYRVGHVEVMGKIAASGDLKGSLVIDEYYELKHKPRLSFPNFMLPYKEGMIMLVNGVETRVKRVPTWEMIVLKIGKFITCSSSDMNYVADYPFFPCSVGDVVEVSSMSIMRIRNRFPSSEQVISRIKSSIVFTDISLRMLSRQDFPRPIDLSDSAKFIIDNNLYDDLCNHMTLSMIISKYDYSQADIVMTMQGMGIKMYGERYFTQDIIQFYDYANYVRLTKMLVLVSVKEFEEDTSQSIDLEIIDEIIDAIEKKEEIFEHDDTIEDMNCPSCVLELMSIYLEQLLLVEHREVIINDNKLVRSCLDVPLVNYYSKDKNTQYKLYRDVLGKVSSYSRYQYARNFILGKKIKYFRTLAIRRYYRRSVKKEIRLKFIKKRKRKKKERDKQILAN